MNLIQPHRPFDLHSRSRVASWVPVNLIGQVPSGPEAMDGWENIYYSHVRVGRNCLQKRVHAVAYTARIIGRDCEPDRRHRCSLPQNGEKTFQSTLHRTDGRRGCWACPRAAPNCGLFPLPQKRKRAGRANDSTANPRPSTVGRHGQIVAIKHDQHIRRIGSDQLRGDGDVLLKSCGTEAEISERYVLVTATEESRKGLVPSNASAVCKRIADHVNFSLIIPADANPTLTVGVEKFCGRADSRAQSDLNKTQDYDECDGNYFHARIVERYGYAGKAA